MTSYLLAGPASEPVSLAEAKAFLRLDEVAEDALVTTLIAAARMHMESVTGRALIEQSWRVVLDDWPETGVLALPVLPVRSITAVTAHDADGSPHALELAQFRLEPGEGACLSFPTAVAGAPVLQQNFGIEVDVLAGYGATGTDVPAPLRQAILALVGYWFEHRDAVITAGSGALVPSGFDRQVAAFKAVRL